jgi:hypothetical protein
MGFPETVCGLRTCEPTITTALVLKAKLEAAGHCVKWALTRDSLIWILKVGQFIQKFFILKCHG